LFYGFLLHEWMIILNLEIIYKSYIWLSRRLNKEVGLGTVEELRNYITEMENLFSKEPITINIYSNIIFGINDEILDLISTINNKQFKDSFY
jgi:hypothetical protein